MASSRRRFLLGAALGGASMARRTVPDTVAAAEPSLRKPDRGRRGRECTGGQRIRLSAQLGPLGANDPMGAVNLITPQKRAAAAALVKTGRTVSLGRVFAPDQHYIRVNQRGTGDSAVDYYGFLYHGVTVTHVDALSTCGTGTGCGTAATRQRRSTRTAPGSPTSRRSVTA